MWFIHSFLFTVLLNQPLNKAGSGADVQYWPGAALLGEEEDDDDEEEEVEADWLSSLLWDALGDGPASLCAYLYIHI